ncbi:MAG: RHS repeat protein [Hymenobacteraceae bacterium]|nr:RHS repeat protein [Hymenobacteraceae bacterium]
MKQTFPKIYKGIFFTVLLLLSACDNDENDLAPIPAPDPTACALVRITEGKAVTDFNYDAQGYITNIVENDGANFSKKETVYTYDTNRQVIRSDYFYDNYPDITNSPTHTVYTYTNGLVSRVEHYYSDDSVMLEEAFMYDLNGRIEKITNSSGSTTTFAYNTESNITEMLIEGDEKIKVEYEKYDNNKTPFSAANGYLNLFNNSANNPGFSTTMQRLDGEDKMITNSDFRYEYNELDLPTRIEKHQDNGFGPVIITIYTYNCK